MRMAMPGVSADQFQNSGSSHSDQYQLKVTNTLTRTIADQLLKEAFSFGSLIPLTPKSFMAKDKKTKELKLD